MAITVEDNPRNFSPVYNKMEYLLSSTKTAETNFSYLVDVYINGSGTKTWRGRIPKRPSDDYCLVDVHRILEATLTSDVGDPSGTQGSYEAANHALTYIVKFGEEYDVAGVLTQFPDLTVDSSRDAINASVEKQEFVDWDIRDYDLDGVTKKFLTNSPDNHNVSINGHGWLYYKEADVLTYYEVNTYDIAGSAISSFRIDPTATSDIIQYIPSSPETLNNIGAGFFLSGAQPVITSSVASYTIHMFAAAIVSETRTFVIKEPCKYSASTVIFQNALGEFDDFTFYLGDIEGYDIQRKDMKVNVDPVSGTSISYSMQERENRTYYSKSSPNITLKSDWLTEAEDAWLLELVNSNEIYLQNGDDLIALFKPRVTDYKKKKVVTDKLFKREITFDFGFDNYRQRG